MKLIKITAAVVVTAILLLTGCGNTAKYNFSDHELSGAIGANDEIFQNASVTFEKKTIEKSVPKIDRYSHSFDRNGGTEKIAITCSSDGKIIDVNIESEGSFISEYSIYGVHTGDTKETAEKLMESKFRNISMLDLGSYISISCIDEEHGAVSIIVDKPSNKVSGISLTRT